MFRRRGQNAVLLMQCAGFRSQLLTEQVKFGVGTLLIGPDKVAVNYAESLRVSREALKAMTASYGLNHPALVYPLCFMALECPFVVSSGAEELIRRGVAIQNKALSSGHIEHAMGLTFLEVVLLNNNRLAEAEQALRESLACGAKLTTHASGAARPHG